MGPANSVQGDNVEAEHGSTLPRHPLTFISARMFNCRVNFIKLRKINSTPHNMETANTSGVSIQWLLLFAMVFSIFLPAFLLQRSAKRKNKNAWTYLAAGIAIGFLGLALGKLLSEAFQPFIPSAGNAFYVSLVFFLVTYSFVYAAYGFLKNKMINR